jgi:mevalonate kinase
MINSFDYENARVLFNQCLYYYKTASFKSVDEKNNMKLMIDHIYLKIVVYKTIYDSRKHVLARDATLVKKDKENINKIYTTLHNSLSMIDDEYKDSELKYLNYIANSKKHIEKVKI